MISEVSRFSSREVGSPSPMWCFLARRTSCHPVSRGASSARSGCVSGALEKGEYEALLSGAGFEDVAVEVTHTYPLEQIAGLSGTPRPCVMSLRRAPYQGRKPEAL